MPTGVAEILVDATGAQGGTATYSHDVTSSGLGGWVQALMPVTAGQIFYIFVGGKGLANGTSFGGGGSGGLNDYGSTGGGGASDIRTSPTNLTTRLIVAGGGGGGAYLNSQVAGGAGGISWKSF